MAKWVRTLAIQMRWLELESPAPTEKLAVHGLQSQC